MRVQELKIGDWVMHNGVPDIVVGTDLNDEHGLLLHDTPYALVENIEPIPITEEILEKNGWKQEKENAWYDEKNSILIRVCELYGEFICYLRDYVLKEDSDDDYDDTKDTLLIRVKWVHELQHILWALGIDDNLKI